MIIYTAIVNAKQVLTKLSTQQRERFYKTPGLSGIEVRIGLSSGPSKEEKELCQEVLKAGLDLRIHAWTGRVDGKPSTVDGKDGGEIGIKQALWAKELGASMVSGNHEKGVWKGQGDKGFNPGAEAFVSEYGHAAKLYGKPDLKVGELGFSKPAFHYPGATISQGSQTPYDIKHVMAYQSTYEDIKKTLQRARSVWLNKPLNVWLGVGRIDENNVIWGTEKATESILKEKVEDITECTLYVGNGAYTQLLEGNKKHRSLHSLIPVWSKF